MTSSKSDRISWNSSRSSAGRPAAAAGPSAAVEPSDMTSAVRCRRAARNQCPARPRGRGVQACGKAVTSATLGRDGRGRSADGGCRWADGRGCVGLSWGRIGQQGSGERRRRGGPATCLDTVRAISPKNSPVPWRETCRRHHRTSRHRTLRPRVAGPTGRFPPPTIQCVPDTLHVTSCSLPPPRWLGMPAQPSGTWTLPAYSWLVRERREKGGRGLLVGWRRRRGHLVAVDDGGHGARVDDVHGVAHVPRAAHVLPLRHPHRLQQPRERTHTTNAASSCQAMKGARSA